jgi:hypothetical protein
MFRPMPRGLRDRRRESPRPNGVHLMLGSMTRSILQYTPAEGTAFSATIPLSHPSPARAVRLCPRLSPRTLPPTPKLAHL